MISLMRYFPSLRDIFNVSVEPTKDKQCPGKKKCKRYIVFILSQSRRSCNMLYLSGDITEIFLKYFQNEIFRGLPTPPPPHGNIFKGFLVCFP